MCEEANEPFFLMLGVGAVLVVFQAGWIAFSMDSGYIRPWQCCFVLFIFKIFIKLLKN